MLSLDRNRTDESLMAELTSSEQQQQQQQQDAQAPPAGVEQVRPRSTRTRTHAHANTSAHLRPASRLQLDVRTKGTATNTITHCRHARRAQAGHGQVENLEPMAPSFSPSRRKYLDAETERIGAYTQRTRSGAACCCRMLLLPPAACAHACRVSPVCLHLAELSFGCVACVWVVVVCSEDHVEQQVDKSSAEDSVEQQVDKTAWQYQLSSVCVRQQ
jgi:hypothetical protein